MEQVGRSGESDGNQQKRMKMPENHGQPPQAPPQKCPRCDSNNTKFCYYNNYSLSQPRYFCKTCRRYWTQGGTLRNVPVGGGCRKAGKRSVKSSTSGGGGGGCGSSSSPATSESSSRSLPPLQITANLSPGLFSGNGSRSQPLSTMSPLYSGGGFFSSLAAMQSQGNQFGGNVLLHLPTPNMAAQIEPQTGLYQMVNPEKSSMESSFYPSDHQTLFQTTRPLGSWTQRFINNSWNVSSASSSSGATTTEASGSSFSPNQWPDHLPGFGPAP